VNARHVTATICLIALCVQAPVRGDEVWTSYKKWTACRVKWIRDGKVRFRAADGTWQMVPVSAVERMSLDDRQEFNKAEYLRSSGAATSALPLYEQALRREIRPDIANFIRYRLMLLYDSAGMLDKAVEMFADLLRDPDFQVLAMGWRPHRAAKAKPHLRARAISRLETLLRSMRPGLAREAANEVLRHIASAPANETAKRFAALSPAQRPAELLRQGNYAAALQAADAVLSASRDRRALADALFVRGVALWHVAQDRPQQLLAAIALARYLVEFPDGPRTAECLYYLALLEEKLGRTGSATMLLNRLLATPGDERYRQKAGAKLKQLQAQAKQ